MKVSVFEEFSELEGNSEIANREAQDHELPTIKGKLKEKADESYRSLAERLSQIYQEAVTKYLPQAKEILTKMTTWLESMITEEGEVYTVKRVVDGDTIELSNGETVVFIGIDAPENAANKKARQMAEISGQDINVIISRGQEAARFVERYLPPGTEVFLEYDTQERDNYKRLLAYVFLRAPDLKVVMNTDTVHFKNGVPHIFLNSQIIKEGYATPMPVKPNLKYADLFDRLAQEAIANNRGLWK